MRTRETAAVGVALEQLCTAYWRPVVSYLQALGCGAEDAEDIAQDFFRNFLRRDGFQRAEQERGTLRGYVKAAVRNHLFQWRRTQYAQCRGGGKVPLSLDSEDAQDVAVQDAAADHCDEQWALTVMDRALAELRTGFEARGKLAFYEQFKASIFLPQEAAAEVAAQIGITRGAYAVEQHRARRRLAELLRHEVAQTVLNPADVDAELTHLMRLLSQTAQPK